jgi:putative membrane protein
MLDSPFFDDATKARITAMARAVEDKSAAAVVVVVRRQSAHYRHADYLVAFAFSLAALAALLFLPQPFAIRAMPLDVALAFLLGAALSANTPPLRRVLISRAFLDDNVERAARAAFVEFGLCDSPRHTGVLVYLSLFEERVEVVTGDAARPALLGDACERAVIRLRRSIEGARSVESFLGPFAELTDAIRRGLPSADAGDARRAEDDDTSGTETEVARV